MILKSLRRVHHFFDRAVNRLFPLDISQVLLLNLCDATEPKRELSGCTFRFLSSQEVASFSSNEAADLGSEMHTVVDERNRCYAALKEGCLLGYAWIATGNIAPEHNSAGHRFAGIGMDLAADNSYLFKCFVLPEHRGQGINHHLLWRLSELLKNEGHCKIVTITSWTNFAFQASSKRTGFERIGHAAEWVVFGKSYFHWSDVTSHGVRHYQPSAADQKLEHSSALSS